MELVTFEDQGESPIRARVAALWDFICDGCGEHVLEGDELAFTTDDERVCGICADDMENAAW